MHASREGLSLTRQFRAARSRTGDTSTCDASARRRHRSGRHGSEHSRQCGVSDEALGGDGHVCAAARSPVGVMVPSTAAAAFPNVEAAYLQDLLPDHKRYALDDDMADAFTAKRDADIDDDFFLSVRTPRAPPNLSVRANPLMAAREEPMSKKLDDAVGFVNL